MATGPTLAAPRARSGDHHPLLIIENAMLSIEQMQICKELHRQHPLVVIWDDHESANNSWRDGAQNHNEGEGAWAARKRAAVKAWHEWLPTREAQSPGDAEFGAASASVNCSISPCWIPVSMARIGKANPKDHAVIQNPKRSLLGPTQEAWLYDQLQRSKGDGVELADSWPAR